MKSWMAGMFCLALLPGTMVVAMGPADIEPLVQQRVLGDRSGACIAVARVDANVATAFACADPENGRVIDGQGRFEIGSISKALQGVLMARLAAQGKLDLDQTLAEALGANVPQLGDEPIRLHHLLTHTSGLPRLPAGMPMSDSANPYADLTPDALVELLERTELSVAPGERWAYSNFGAMLLSLAIVRQAGEDLDRLFERELFGPLGMDKTAIGGAVLAGHDANGRRVPAWDFDVNLAGVGGLRSSLDDMVRFMQAALGHGPEPVVTAIRDSFAELSADGGQAMAWGWVKLPLNGRQVLVHDGGTYGFSSFLVIDPERGLAAVVLSDTSLVDQGSLGDLALHLIDPELPLGQARLAPTRLEGVDLADYVGDYPLYAGDQQFMDDFVLRVFEDDQVLQVQGTGGGVEQPAFAVDPDGVDRFVHPGLGLELQFIRDESGRVTTLDFTQGGLSLEGRRR